MSLELSAPVKQNHVRPPLKKEIWVKPGRQAGHASSWIYATSVNTRLFQWGFHHSGEMGFTVTEMVTVTLLMGQF